MVGEDDDDIDAEVGLPVLGSQQLIPDMLSDPRSEATDALALQLSKLAPLTQARTRIPRPNQ